ncbi:ecdysone-induced protein 75B-like [Sipha flava]|uniref:Ecdysone-induced protein 75B-like n=1 Tax=Sipha flava TaxID=143950 RepID=A0A2S2Q4W7_9HEMI|nr:ecdysone-induced protein 75B-like [Sipha flava]
MLSTFAVCFWATTAFAACNVKTRVHYIRAEDRSRGAVNSYFPERLQSRTSSIFGSAGGQAQTAATGFPYRFVFPANHPALSRPVYSSPFAQTSHQSESPYSAEDLFSPSSSKHHPLSEFKNQQQQPLGYETIGKVQYEYFGGGGGGGKHLVQPQPYHLIKQPKHYQSYELGPNAANTVQHQPNQPVHQSFYPSTSASVAQPIMLLIPSSGQPGAPYQTLVLVPSSASSPPPSPPPPPSLPQHQSPVFTGFHPQIHHLPPPAQFLPGFVTHPRGPPMVASFPSGLGGGGGGSIGLGRFPGAQLFHRSHEPLQKQQHHSQYSQQKSSHSSPLQLPPSTSYQSPASYQGSGSVNVQHTTATGSASAAAAATAAAAAAAAAAAQQPLEDKVSHGSGASGENSDDRSENSAETKREEKSPEFGDKTNAKLPKRIVVT